MSTSGALPLNLLREAIVAVPAVKYALGVTGIVAAIAIIKGLIVDSHITDWRVVLMVPVAMLILMTAVVVFSRLTTTAPKHFFIPAMVLMYCFLSLTIAVSVLTLSSMFFHWPLDLRHWITGSAPSSSQVPSNSQGSANPSSQIASDAGTGARKLGSIAVLIADFEGGCDDPRNISLMIKRQLDDPLGAYDDVEVRDLHQAVGSRAEAQRLAKQVGAPSIVLWGSCIKQKRVASILVNFEIVGMADMSKLMRSQREILEAPIDQLETFSLQHELSEHMEYLISVVVGLVRFKVQDYDSALDSFNTAARIYHTPDQMIGRAVVYYYVGNCYAWRAAHKKSMLPPESGLGPALTAADRRDLKLAIDALNTALSIDPNLAGAYAARGHALYHEDRLDPAIADYNKAIEVAHKADCELTGIYLNLGNAYRAKGDFQKAIRALGEDATAYAFFLMGDIYRAEQDDDKAIEYYRRGLALSPGEGPAHVNIGLLYWKEGLVLDAFAHFDSAVECTPNLP
jgi:tetratricopeptide (TPR) repeat protein